MKTIISRSTFSLFFAFLTACGSRAAEPTDTSSTPGVATLQDATARFEADAELIRVDVSALASPSPTLVAAAAELVSDAKAMGATALQMEQPESAATTVAQAHVLNTSATAAPGGMTQSSDMQQPMNQDQQRASTIMTQMNADLQKLQMALPTTSSDPQIHDDIDSAYEALAQAARALEASYENVSKSPVPH